MKTALLLLSSIALVSAHLCFVHPTQRNGGEGMSSPAANICALQTGPCGGDPTGPPKYTAKPGDTVEVILMKNLDHFNSRAPGNFTLYGWSGTSRSPLLALIPDTSAPSLSLYRATLPVPSNTRPGKYILQAVYSPNNPQAPPVFYQCVDVQIVAANETVY